MDALRLDFGFFGSGVGPRTRVLNQKHYKTHNYWTSEPKCSTNSNCLLHHRTATQGEECPTSVPTATQKFTKAMVFALNSIPSVEPSAHGCLNKILKTKRNKYYRPRSNFFFFNPLSFIPISIVFYSMVCPLIISSKVCT